MVLYTPDLVGSLVLLVLGYLCDDAAGVGGNISILNLPIPPLSLAAVLCAIHVDKRCLEVLFLHTSFFLFGKDESLDSSNNDCDPWLPMLVMEMYPWCTRLRHRNCWKLIPSLSPCSPSMRRISPKKQNVAPKEDFSLMSPHPASSSDWFVGWELPSLPIK
ncbi:hypothetical protein ACHAXR_010270 [Thalassiosira sp. AJA248-18]